MNATIGFLKANPAVLVALVATALAALVLGILAATMWRSGASLRPIVFMAVFMAIVGGPQVLFHLAQGFGWIPKRDLTWVAAKDLPASGFLEVEDALTVREGKFTQPAAVFGTNHDPDLITNLLRLGAEGPFASAEIAQMAIIPPAGTTVVARYGDAGAARTAGLQYLESSVGFVPTVGADGAWTATRPAGDVIKVVVAGRTLLAVTGPNERDVTERLASAPVRVTREGSPGAAAAREFWFYRPAVLATVTGLLVLLATLWFFKGSSWAATIPAVAGTSPLSIDELRARLLAVNALEVPFSVAEESPGGRVVVTWRFADARWVDMARAHGMRRTHRILMELDPKEQIVRPTDQFSSIDWSAGPGGGALQWRAGMGITFFQVEHRRVFGLQVDEHGRFQPKLSYSYTFNLQEMKAPFIQAVTNAGWTWRPSAWRGPGWLNWLTD